MWYVYLTLLSVLKMKTFCERRRFYYMDCSLQILNFKFISLTLRIKIALKRHNIKVQVSYRKGMRIFKNDW